MHLHAQMHTDTGTDARCHGSGILPSHILQGKCPHIIQLCFPFWVLALDVMLLHGVPYKVPFFESYS